mgnify:CR=1 FL=1
MKTAPMLSPQRRAQPSEAAPLETTCSSWGGPTMTVGHALFAGTLTAYILIAIRFEERDLVRQLGDRYMTYRQRVPMLVPGTRRAAGSPSFTRSRPVP